MHEKDGSHGRATGQYNLDWVSFEQRLEGVLSSTMNQPILAIG